MMQKKNKILTDQIKIGRLKHPDDPVVLVKRPILQTLWEITNKNIPKNQMESFEQYFKKMQGFVDVVV